MKPQCRRLSQANCPYETSRHRGTSWAKIGQAERRAASRRPRMKKPPACAPMGGSGALAAQHAVELRHHARRPRHQQAAMQSESQTAQKSAPPARNQADGPLSSPQTGRIITAERIRGERTKESRRANFGKCPTALARKGPATGHNEEEPPGWSDGSKHQASERSRGDLAGRGEQISLRFRHPMKTPASV